MKRWEWRRLDNSAKIFPISSGKKHSTVFRISAVLKEKIKKNILEEAVKLSLYQYQYFKVKMSNGFFWNYLEYNTKDPIVEEENDYPCKYIDPRKNQQYLFKVTYFDCKINIDIFHSLTDGNSGIVFFKEIIYNYLELSHPNDFQEELRKVKKVDISTEDSYLKNYDKKVKSRDGSKKAYILSGKTIKLGAVSAVHGIIDLKKLKEECKKEEVTITQYLTAVLIYSIYTQNYLKYRGRKPIKICIPINLKKYFPSNTMSNFFSYMILEANMKNESFCVFHSTNSESISKKFEHTKNINMTNKNDSIYEENIFRKILDFVKDQFEQKLQEEAITKTMSKNVKLGINPLIKIIPLFLKRIIVRLSYLEIRKYSTTTFSNIGRIGIIGKYKDYIEDFLIMIAPDTVERIKCSACSFEDKLVFTFTSILDDAKIEKGFCQFLQAKGIPVKIESNGVLDVISTENK